MKLNKIKLIFLIFLQFIFLKDVHSQSPWVFPGSAYNFPDFTLPIWAYNDCDNDVINISVPGNIYIGNNTILNPKSGNLKAGKSIILNPGTTIISGIQGCTGDFTRLEINNLSCDIVIVNSLNGRVKKNEKIEFGIKLPQNILDAINNYFNGITGQPRINPYNPDQTEPDYIDINAIFSSPTGKIHFVNGFFYRSYEVNSSSNGWNELANDFPFRVRFSPDEIGQWTVSFNISSSVFSVSNLTIDPNCSILVNNGFYCDANPDNLGPLIVGHHNRYLRYRDEQKSFFAIGENIS